jgi:hypothetical protein
LWDEKIDADYLNFEEFVEFTYFFLTLDDTLVPMFVFKLLDVDNRDEIDAESLIYFVFSLYGKNAEKNNDARLVISRLRDLSAGPINKELYASIVHAYPAILRPVWELKDGFTKLICGYAYWSKYRDWRINKIFEKIEDQSFVLSDYYIDDSCVVRFFDRCGGDIPAALKDKVENLRAKHLAEIALLDPEEQKRLRKAQRKAERPHINPYETDVLQIMKPIARRLTVNVDNIGGNKYARALAFGKNYGQTRDHAGRVLENEHDKSKKSKHSSHHAKESEKDKEKEEQKLEEDMKNDKHHHHHHHHHNHTASEAAEAKERGVSFDEEVITKPLFHQHEEDNKKPEPQTKQKPRHVNGAKGSGGIGGAVRRLSALVGLGKNDKDTSTHYSDIANETKTAVKTSTDHFGEAIANAKAKDQEAKAKHHQHQLLQQDDDKDRPKDELDAILERKKRMENRPEPPPLDDSPKHSGRKKSIIERVSFVFYQVHTKKGISKPKKYKVAPE